MLVHVCASMVHLHGRLGMTWCGVVGCVVWFRIGSHVASEEVGGRLRCQAPVSWHPVSWQNFVLGRHNLAGIWGGGLGRKGVVHAAGFIKHTTESAGQLVTAAVLVARQCLQPCNQLSLGERMCEQTHCRPAASSTDRFDCHFLTDPGITSSCTGVGQ